MHRYDTNASGTISKAQFVAFCADIDDANRGRMILAEVATQGAIDGIDPFESF